MAILLKIFVVSLGLFVFLYNCYCLVWKDMDEGYRLASLMSILIALGVMRWFL